MCAMISGLFIGSNDGRPPQAYKENLVSLKFGFRKSRDCTIYVSNTKALISCVVTAQLICAFVFAYAYNLFSHDAAQFTINRSLRSVSSQSGLSVRLCVY